MYLVGLPLEMDAVFHRVLVRGRWRGSKIKMGFAKGDYLERLKCEWVEAKETKAKAAREVEEAKAAATDHASYSAPPVLRIRRRSGGAGGAS